MSQVFRCDWCGRFYSSSLPEGSACPNHITEHNERLTKEIEKSNARMAAQAPVPSALSVRVPYGANGRGAG